MSSRLSRISYQLDQLSDWSAGAAKQTMAKAAAKRLAKAIRSGKAAAAKLERSHKRCKPAEAKALTKLRQSFKRISHAAKHLSPKAKRYWRKAHGNQRVARLKRLTKPLFNLSFRRVGNCRDGSAASARTSDRMVII